MEMPKLLHSQCPVRPRMGGHRLAARLRPKLAGAATRVRFTLRRPIPFLKMQRLLKRLLHNLVPRLVAHFIRDRIEQRLNAGPVMAIGVQRIANSLRVQVADQYAFFAPIGCQMELDFHTNTQEGPCRAFRDRGRSTTWRHPLRCWRARRHHLRALFAPHVLRIMSIASSLRLFRKRA